MLRTCKMHLMNMHRALTELFKFLGPRQSLYTTSYKNTSNNASLPAPNRSDISFAIQGNAIDQFVQQQRDNQIKESPFFIVPANPHQRRWDIAGAGPGNIECAHQEVINKAIVIHGAAAVVVFCAPLCSSLSRAQGMRRGGKNCWRGARGKTRNSSQSLNLR